MKEIINNDELVQHIVDEIPEIPEDTEVSYEVWAVGYDKNKEATGADLFIKNFTDPDEAVKLADKLTIADILELDDDIHAGQETKESEVQSAIISVEIESVIIDEDDGSSFNIGTVYKRDLWIDGEYGSEENAPDDELDETVKLKETDYTFDEEGNLVVACNILSQFNKNDLVQVMFVDEKKQPILTYKIVSKTTANDFVCEFEF